MNPSDPTDESPFDTGDVMPRHVALFCDHPSGTCQTEIDGDFLVASRTEAFAALRRYAAEHGWDITEVRDYCPEHRRDRER